MRIVNVTYHVRTHLFLQHYVLALWCRDKMMSWGTHCGVSLSETQAVNASTLCYTQWAMYGSQTIGTKLTGWSRHGVTHTAHWSSTTCTQYTWTVKVLSVVMPCICIRYIYTSCCYVAPVCIAAWLPWDSLWQSFTESVGPLVIIAGQPESTLTIFVVLQ